MSPATKATWHADQKTLWVETDESGHSPVGYADHVPTTPEMLEVHDWDHTEAVWYDPRLVLFVTEQQQAKA